MKEAAAVFKVKRREGSNYDVWSVRNLKKLLTGWTTRTLLQSVVRTWDSQQLRTIKRATFKGKPFIKSRTKTSLKETDAGRTLFSIQKADSIMLQTLFMNVHAVVKYNRPQETTFGYVTLINLRGLILVTLT